MQEKKQGTPWSPEEDDQLRAAVAALSENDNWKEVAKRVPGRTNKACRKRWLHSLSPNVKKTAWTKDEDELLLRLYDTHGPKWSHIARQIDGRTDDACSKRYREALDPALKKTDWTAEEDVQLYQALDRHGAGRWKEVGIDLTRSSLACRNRWRMLERRKATTIPPGPSSLIQHPTLPVEPGQVPSSSWIPPPQIPTIQTEFWDSQPQCPTNFSPHIVTQDLPELGHHPAFLSPYTASPAPPEAEPLTPQTEVPPFQYSSSSLSLALSLPASSPSTSYLRTPSSQNAQLSTPTTPTVEPPPVDASFMSNPQDFASRHSPVDRPSATSTATSTPMITDREMSMSTDHTSADTLSAESSLGPSLSPRSAVQAYPTPMSSPLPPVEELDSSCSAPPSTAPSVSALPPDPNRHYRTPEQKRATKPKITRRKHPDSRPQRLSATLPVTDDPNILPYACGHDSCWPESEPSSKRCYATSQELTDHWREDHFGQDLPSQPFRCGLPECGKHWRSINGLQYHLQISRAHYQQALSERATEDGADGEGSSKVSKLFRCHRPGCRHQYKQLSGLRYHMVHGHREEKLPTQLKEVPPTLARKIAMKGNGEAQG